jgi:hypothetical protein
MDNRKEFLDKVSTMDARTFGLVVVMAEYLINPTQIVNDTTTVHKEKSDLFDNFQLQSKELNDSTENLNTTKETSVKTLSCEPNVKNNSDKESTQWKREQINKYTEFAYSLIKENEVIDKQKFMDKFGKRFMNEFSASDLQKVNLKSSLFKWEEKIHNNIYNRLILTGKIVFTKPNYISSDFIMKKAKNIKTIVSTENTMQQ